MSEATMPRGRGNRRSVRAERRQSSQKDSGGDDDGPRAGSGKRRITKTQILCPNCKLAVMISYYDVLGWECKCERCGEVRRDYRLVESGWIEISEGGTIDYHAAYVPRKAGYALEFNRRFYGGTP